MLKFLFISWIFLIASIECTQDEEISKTKQIAKIEDLKNSLNNFPNTSSDYYLIINVLNDLNLLEYYLNRQDNNNNLTKITTVFNPKNLVPETGPSDKIVQATGKESYVTKISVYYSNKDVLTCSQVPYNSSILECSDKILGAKLRSKLEATYTIKVQPLFVDKLKIVCPRVINAIKALDCTLPTTRDTARRKLIWKVLLTNKNQTLEARSSRILNDTARTYIKTPYADSTEKQGDENGLKSQNTNSQMTPIDDALDVISSYRIILCVVFIAITGGFVLGNTILCVYIRKRKIKPLNMSKLNTMSLSNRLLQNYLDVSLISDGKVSTRSASKISGATKGNAIDKYFRGPTPLRSSTSVENYASSSKQSGSICDLQSKTNFSDLSTFRITSADENFITNENEMNGASTTNPYNSISCLTMSDDKLDCSERKGKKLKHSVSSVAIQADVSKDFLSNPHPPRKPVNKNYIKKGAQANYSDNESQIMCIELDKNNMTLNEDYVSVADLYNLASKHLDQAASVRVNDYSAFKNSLNFQLQAAKAAAIAENSEYDVANKDIVIKDLIIQEPPKMTSSLISVNQLKSSNEASPSSNKQESFTSSFSSTSVPLNGTNNDCEGEEESSVSSVQVSDSQSDHGNQKDSNSNWTTLNSTHQSSKGPRRSHSLNSNHSNKKVVYPNDLYMSMNSTDWLKSMFNDRPLAIECSSPTNNETPYLTKITNTSDMSIYDMTLNRIRNNCSSAEDALNQEVMLENGDESKTQDQWTTVSISTSSPSQSFVTSNNNNDKIIKIDICGDNLKHSRSNSNGTNRQEMRPISIRAGQQYHKLYKLNKSNTESPAFKAQ